MLSRLFIAVLFLFAALPAGGAEPVIPYTVTVGATQTTQVQDINEDGSYITTQNSLNGIKTILNVKRGRHTQVTRDISCGGDTTGRQLTRDEAVVGSCT